MEESPQLSILILEKDKNCFQLRQVIFQRQYILFLLRHPLVRGGGVHGLEVSAVGGGGSNLAMDEHPIQGGVAIFLVASYYRNRS